MKYSLLISMVFLAFFVSQCGKTTKEDSSVPLEVRKVPKEHAIVIYGSMTCDHCIAFLKKADSLSVQYSFKDVETNQIYYSELVKKIQDAKYQGYVSFPVIEVDGSIHVNPEFEQFQTLIR